jgi:hypothetical protein
VKVTGDGKGVASHAGSLLLAELADGVGLTAGLSAAMTHTRRRRSAHDPGVVLCHLAVMLADGGDCLADIAGLRQQPDLFGGVASDPTVWRAGRRPHIATARCERQSAMTRTVEPEVCWTQQATMKGHPGTQMDNVASDRANTDHVFASQAAAGRCGH